MINSVLNIKTVICLLCCVWKVCVIYMQRMPAKSGGRWTSKAIFHFCSILFFCSLFTFFSHAISGTYEWDSCVKYSNSFKCHPPYPPSDSIIRQYQQKYIKININISVTAAPALYLYDLASRLAGDCLGEDEEEEGSRWVVEYPGVSEADPRRWSLLGELDPEPPPPPERGELTRWAGKVELE